ncbi:MAG: 50S ribosomal protein L25 [Clostridiales bacterium]|nr:MAG: 50S ribosomal protein L25 [Clostridiales bacterium]
MKRFKLDAEVRDKGISAKHLKSEGFIPAIVYGAHIDAISVKIPKREVEKFIRTHHVGSSLDVEVGGESHFVLLKDIQLDVIKRDVIHLDFQALKAGEKVRVNVPIYLQGRDDLKNIIVQELLSEIEISVLPKYLIDSIEVDVSNVKVGDQLTVAELEVNNNENIEILSNPEQLIFTAVEPSVYEEEVEEEDEEGEVEEEEKEEVTEE